jgi:hypothetical protein
MLPCFFSFPSDKLWKRETEGDGSRPGASPLAASTIPTLLRIQDNGRLAFLRVGDQDVHLADIHTLIAPVADLGIEGDRGARGAGVGKRIDFVLSHSSSPHSVLTVVLRKKPSRIANETISHIAQLRI